MTTTRKKQDTFWLDDNNGIFAYGFRKKETALKAILDLWNDDPEYHKERYGDMLQNITLENVKEETGWYCKKCSYWTMGEAMCLECGRNLRSFSTMYVIYFHS